MSFSRRNFAPRDYKDERGRVWEMFEMTFNGFVMLVMGYTGPKAMAIKEAYVAEFDRMRAELESIKADALGRAHDQLEGRNPDWPLIRKEYLRVSGTGREYLAATFSCLADDIDITLAEVRAAIKHAIIERRATPC